MNKKIDIVSGWIERKHSLAAVYVHNCQKYKKLLQLLITAFEEQIRDSEINAIVKGRVKSFDNLYKKLLIKSFDSAIESPFSLINDLIGLRIVVPFLEDLANIENIVTSSFKVTEVDHKSKDLSIKEFGYDSTHLMIDIPSKILTEAGFDDAMTAEIQIRTILQDAWAEVEHELIYKTSIDKIETSIKRKMTALNATLSLADITFQEIRDYQNKRYADIQERHKKLMDKVSTIPEKAGKAYKLSSSEGGSSNAAGDTSAGVNDLLVEAINAHIENRLDTALDLYTKLLIISPNHYIYNHRGLIYFTLSEYQNALDDFSKAIEIEPNDTRVYTNRGLTFRMLGRYDEAIEDFNLSLALNPLWPDTFYGRALTYYDMGNIKGALEDIDRAISLKPDFKQAVRFKQYISNHEMEI
jgi:ppGpp synthetase/RelA/SpoT-type nucleotidyltranferase